VCLFTYVLVSCFLILGVLGPWEFLWRVGSYTFCVCDSAVWSAGPVQLYSGTFLERMAGLYRFFPFLWLCCSGYGTVEMARGVVCLSSRFLQFTVSSLGGLMSVVGFRVHKSSFFGRFVVFFRAFVFYKLLIFFNLLQVVQAE
jgi:hypothetical protein